MNNEIFYKELETEFKRIFSENSEDELLQKLKDKSQRDSQIFMIWFLEFYGKLSYNGGLFQFRHEIVDGNGDSSCDIIFYQHNSTKEKIYYVVQSKWNQIQNINSEISSTEIKKSLNDFQTILEGKKENTSNERFNTKLKELRDHIEKNGKVEFLFIALCKNNSDFLDNLKAFQDKNNNVKVRVFDIDHLKRDFIEVKYKNLFEQNLLEKSLNPKIDEITIPIERLNENSTQIYISKPFDSLIILVRPKLFFDLFEKYRYTLFIENIRNPIKESSINSKIEETLISNPAFFWYYNNGITAITDFLPEVSEQAKEIKISGIQIINGAQTVHSIYKIYKERETKLDKDVLITLRLYKTGGENFTREVTKYTNSQNPLHARDYWANDKVQIRLQKESFNTKYWYEKRKEEFVNPVPEGIEVVSNKYMAIAYFSYLLELPKMNGVDKKIFMSKLEKDIGFYEMVFSEDTNYEDILAAYSLYVFIEHLYQVDSVFNNLALAILGLFKSMFKKYFELKNEEVPKITNYVLEKFEKKDFLILEEIINYIYSFLKSKYKMSQIENENFLTNEFPSIKLNLLVKAEKDKFKLEKRKTTLIKNKVVFHLNEEEISEIQKNISGSGGWQNLLLKLQSKIDGNYIHLDYEDISLIKKYSKNQGGFQTRLSFLLKKITELGNLTKDE